MKLRKLIALLMAMVMVFALAACGSSSTDEGSASAGNDTGEVAEEGGDDSGSAEASDGAFTPIDTDPLEISFSTTYNETETGGEIIKQWMAYLEEYSNGNISVNVIGWGGTVYGDADILDALSSGAVNMTTFGHMPHITTLNYLGFPSFAPGGVQAALDFFDTIMFKNEETSALVLGEAADNNIIYLNVLPGGANAFCAKFEFTDLDSLVANCGSFGNMDATIFEAMGFQVTSIGPADCYTALQTGQIDATQMGLTPMISMQWYDEAPYWALDGTYSAGNFITANLDWWNSLTADQQSVIQAASDAVQEWSIEVYSTAIDEDVATVEDATGNPFVQFSDADIDRIWAANFDSKVASSLPTAEANGKLEGMVKIMELAAELTGYDWTYEG